MLINRVIVAALFSLLSCATNKSFTFEKLLKRSFHYQTIRQLINRSIAAALRFPNKTKKPLQTSCFTWPPSDFSCFPFLFLFFCLFFLTENHVCVERRILFNSCKYQCSLCRYFVYFCHLFLKFFFLSFMSFSQQKVKQQKKKEDVCPWNNETNRLMVNFYIFCPCSVQWTNLHSQFKLRIFCPDTKYLWKYIKTLIFLNFFFYCTESSCRKLQFLL